LLINGFQHCRFFSFCVHDLTGYSSSRPQLLAIDFQLRLATIRCRRLALASDSELVCVRTKWRLPADSLTVSTANRLQLRFGPRSRDGPHRKHRFQQFFCCCVFLQQFLVCCVSLCCRGNVYSAVTEQWTSFPVSRFSAVKSQYGLEDPHFALFCTYSLSIFPYFHHFIRGKQGQKSNGYSPPLCRKPLFTSNILFVRVCSSHYSCSPMQELYWICSVLWYSIAL
jgi:hypothetical protein